MLGADISGTSSPLTPSQLVMSTLQRALDQFFKSEGKKEKDSKLKGFWKKKPSTESQLEHRMRRDNPQSLDDVKTLVLGMADEWRTNHGKVCEVRHQPYMKLTASRSITFSSGSVTL